MKNQESPLFVALSRYLFFVINIFVLYLFLRGHNLPGGGFIAGAGTAISFVMLVLANGSRDTEALLPLRPLTFAGLGLFLALVVGVAPMFSGEEFLKHHHLKLDGGAGLGLIYLGTPLWFDLGVYLIVVGVLLKLILVLVRAKERHFLISKEERASCALPGAHDLEDRRMEGGSDA
jgi:multisubunit Na+/H+ antiporter MnhB subunit